jgi:hypothetical protein
MAQSTGDLGAVMTCMTTQCSYNKSEECMAPIVSVGNGDHPSCDTFTTGEVELATRDANVARCQISACAWNDIHHCDASGVTLGNHQSHADCMTFRPRV